MPRDRKKARSSPPDSSFSGALMGVVSAILKFANVNVYLTDWQAMYGEAIAIIPYIALIVFMIGVAMKVNDKKQLQ